MNQDCGHFQQINRFLLNHRWNTGFSYYPDINASQVQFLWLRSEFVL